MLASALITRAYYYSGIVQREGAQPSQTQSQDGLIELNSLLSKFKIDGNGIPYIQHNTLNLVQGQESYIVNGLCKIQSLTYNLGDVRYSLQSSTVFQYFGSTRANNIQALPYRYYPERYLGGMKLWFYFLPLEGMTLNITGVYGFGPVVFNTEMDDGFDSFFQDYLMFQLAKRLCAFYGETVSKELQDILNDYDLSIKAMNPPDLTVRTTNVYSGTGYSNTYTSPYNFGRGWTP